MSAPQKTRRIITSGCRESTYGAVQIPGASSVRTKARLIQPADMAARFPGCLAYLEARRLELETRHVSGGVAAERQFYQFGRSQSLVKFDSAKILWLLRVGLRRLFAIRDVYVLFFMVCGRRCLGTGNFQRDSDRCRMGIGE